MVNPVLVLDYANLFCGSRPGDETKSNHLSLAEVKLPSLEVQYVDHRPGGAPFATEIDVIMTKLEAQFTLLGITPQVMRLMKSWEAQMNDFFIYGNLRDYMTNVAVQLEVLIRGQLGHVDADPFRRGDVFHVKYAIRGIIHYEMNLATPLEGSQPVYLWDFFNNEFRVSR